MLIDYNLLPITEFNPSQPGVAFLYPLKTSEKQQKSNTGLQWVKYELSKIGRNAVRNNVLDWWTFCIWIWEVYFILRFLNLTRLLMAATDWWTYQK